MTSIEQSGIYPDLLRHFRVEGWNIYVVTPREPSLQQPTGLSESEGVHILGVRTLNLQKTSIIEKGIGQILVESQYKSAIKRYLNDVQFDLILYSTPPITFPMVDKMLVSDRKAMGERGYEFLKKNYLVENTYDVIMKHFY